MTGRKALRSVHMAGTIWFIVCVGYMLIMALRRAGFNWWVVFSLSGHSAIVVFLLISLYLFALFRGVGGAQQIANEHPLTTTPHYTVLYVAAPFLGALAGGLAIPGEGALGEIVLAVALATLVTTFCVWVVVDPALGLIEMILPESRRYRAARLALAEAERRRKKLARERLLDMVLTREQTDRMQWRKKLRTEAEQLALLLGHGGGDLADAERRVVDIGARAWQMGGVSCMRELQEMALALYRQEEDKSPITDLISAWWDGVGAWRHCSVPR